MPDVAVKPSITIETSRMYATIAHYLHPRSKRVTRENERQNLTHPANSKKADGEFPLQDIFLSKSAKLADKGMARRKATAKEDHFSSERL